MEKCIKDENGRFIILDLKVENSHFILVNIYAPNDSTQQVKFFKDLQGLLAPFSGENIIIGGDFNCPLTSADKMGGRSVHFKQNVINEITKLSSLYSLCEVWRGKNGDKQGFSWRDKTMKVQCRLDYFLISKRLLNTSKQCLSLFAPNTDHSAVVTHIQSEELSRKTGPGIWKFNSALLKDNEYVNGICECVQLAKVKYKDVKTTG